MAGSLLLRTVIAVAIAVTAQPLADATASTSGRGAEAIVQFDASTATAERRAAVRAAGGVVVRDLHVIDALGVRLPPGGSQRLSRMAGVRAVTPNAAMRPDVASHGNRWGAWSPADLSTAYVHSTRADKVWTDRHAPATGGGVAVAVIDTGIAGELPDFRTSADDPNSRVIASVVTNPDATTPSDRYGHGTHVAGLVAGNGRALSASDPSFNRYIGTAPAGEPRLDQGVRRPRQRVPHRRHRGPAVRRGSRSRLRDPRREPVPGVVARAALRDRSAQRRGGGGLGARRRRGGRGRQPRLRTGRRLVLAGQRPLRDHGRRGRRPGHEDHRRRQPHAMVESRHHPGRVREARHRRSGRAHRRAAGPGAATSPRCARAAWSTNATSGSAAPRWRPRSWPASPPT